MIRAYKSLLLLENIVIVTNALFNIERVKDQKAQKYLVGDKKIVETFSPKKTTLIYSDDLFAKQNDPFILQVLRHMVVSETVIRGFEINRIKCASKRREKCFESKKNKGKTV